MAFSEKNIVNTYAALFEGLSSVSKVELIALLTKSLKADKISKKDNFFKSFGAFGSKKPAEEIISDIKSSRKFKVKEINL